MKSTLQAAQWPHSAELVTIRAIMARESYDESVEAIGKRLRLIRLAYSAAQKYEKPMGQAEFARLCDISAPGWNNYESFNNRISLENARKVRRRTGVGLDYIFDGDLRDLPHALAVEIEKIEKAESVVRAKRA